MTDDRRDDLGDDDEDRGESRIRGALAWFPYLAFAIIAFEFVSDPAWGVVIACLKIGGGDFLTAWWVRKADPIRPRGRACSWFFVATAFLKTGGAALLILFTAALVIGAMKAGKPAAGPPMRMLMGSLLVLFFCYMLMAVVSWVAMASAVRNGVRVWADSRASRARKLDAWPPYSPFGARRQVNMAGIATLYATVSAVVSISILVIILAAIVQHQMKQFGYVVMGLGAAVAIWSAVMMYRVNLKIIAQHPHECFPSETIQGWPLPDSLSALVRNGAMPPLPWPPASAP